MKKRVIVGLTGPSGVGKGTGLEAILHQLKAQVGGEWRIVSTSEPLRREVEIRLGLEKLQLDDRREKEIHRNELDRLQLELRAHDPKYIMKQAIALHPECNVIIDRPCTDDDFEVLLNEDALFIIINAPDELRRQKMGVQAFEQANACDSEQAMFRNLQVLSSKTNKIIEVNNDSYDPTKLIITLHSQIYRHFDPCR